MKEKVSNTYILGLKRGQVKLVPRQTDWHKDAAGVIKKLKEILGNSAIDIQHVGSTAILNICAKPIIDIAVGVGNVADILLQREALGGCKRSDFVCSRGFFTRYENSSYSCS